MGSEEWTKTCWLLCCPRTDLDIIHAELRAKDLAAAKAVVESFKKMKMALTKQQKEEQAGAEKAVAWLEVRAGCPVPAQAAVGCGG